MGGIQALPLSLPLAPLLTTSGPNPGFFFFCGTPQGQFKSQILKPRPQTADTNFQIPYPTFYIPDPRSQIFHPRPQMPDSTPQTPDPRLQLPDSRFHIPHPKSQIPQPRTKILNPRPRSQMLTTRCQILDSTSQIPNPRSQIPDSTFCIFLWGPEANCWPEIAWRSQNPKPEHPK